MQPSLRSAIMNFFSPIDFPLLPGMKDVVVVNPFGKRRILGSKFGNLSMADSAIPNTLPKDPFGSGSTHGTF